ncbi:hypothetical protein PENPOL_c008G04810 [Penicillium polonicum]|uniref:Uncharacterized protein n=1 Tax=Penicillium polonicum TaxID=60169 RepID=A0A1V6NGL1_PENPO|nr:hypothetical protein PENPOL_c008G04810 [Penicillium polonicum]
MSNAENRTLQNGPNALSLLPSVLPAMTAYSSSSSDVGGNFVLVRYLNGIVIPATESSLIMSEYYPETPKPRKSALKLSTTPTTPEQQTVSFTSATRTQSPGSVNSGRSTSSVTYKSRMYCSEQKPGS